MPGDFVSDEKDKLPSYLLDKSSINRCLGKEMAICNTVLRMFCLAVDPLILRAELSIFERSGDKVTLVNPLMHLVEWTENNQMVLYDSSRIAFSKTLENENRFDKAEDIENKGGK